MKFIIITCASALFIALFDLPIGYFTFLRIFVTIGSVAIIITEFKKFGLNYWVMTFGLVAIIFNPIIPIYLNNKNYWIPIDIISGLLFVIKAIINNRNQKKQEI